MKRVRLFGIDIDPIRLEDAAIRVVGMAKDGGPCRYVVTPNVDHVLIYQKTEALRAAYSDAALVIADGLPLVLAAQALGRPIPERVAGSDLVPAVFGQARERSPLKVFLLGAGPGVAERAARRVEDRWKGVRVVGTYSPPFGFERDRGENETILHRVREAAPELLLVGLGAPKQEVWVHAHRRHIAASMALCIGATIDFLAGEKARAPDWMKRIGLEWFHRMSSEPRRLAPRYASNAIGFPKLVYKEWRELRRS
jgi:N-acetylglucosaminyldiphosphoundecaprenol N-acetyl-beta-D-mannosaminyltransferase